VLIGRVSRIDDDEYDLASMRDSFMKEFAARPLEYDSNHPYDTFYMISYLVNQMLYGVI
jgi:hypothetical protein